MALPVHSNCGLFGVLSSKRPMSRTPGVPPPPEPEDVDAPLLDVPLLDASLLDAPLFDVEAAVAPPLALEDTDVPLVLEVELEAEVALVVPPPLALSVVEDDAPAHAAANARGTKRLAARRADPALEVRTRDVLGICFIMNR
jgi:hypothetical protein